MKEIFRRYPIGIQNFEQLRNMDCVYIDKTALIYQLVHTDTVYFLSRPRRFGKSLLVSTLDAYFSGKKDLFKGLAIEQLEQEWTVYPVLHIDFSRTKYTAIEDLQEQLNLYLSGWERTYGKNEEETSYAARLTGLLQRIYQQTGKQVVVLIDEYDAPLLDSNSDSALQGQLRIEMRKFFSPLKAQGQYLRFYSSICGITEQELRSQMLPDIERIAQANNETYEEACQHLKRQYDGYHFSKNCEDIYNPFSLFNAFSQRDYKSFWFSTGTPTFLIEMLQQMDFSLNLLEKMEVKDEDFDKATEVITDPIPVLYQSGYLTIKGYEPLFRTYTLGYPNEEVKIGFIETLIPSYLNQPTRESNFYVVSFVRDLMKGDIEQCLLRTRSFFSSIPYDLENNQEKHYQTIFYLLFRLMGQYVDVEVKNAIGRADVVIKMPDTIYVLEFKVDGTPEEALAQINSKQYAIPYEIDHRKVVKVGVNFDSVMRTLGQWKIEYS